MAAQRERPPFGRVCHTRSVPGTSLGVPRSPAEPRSVSVRLAAPGYKLKLCSYDVGHAIRDGGSHCRQARAPNRSKLVTAISKEEPRRDLAYEHSLRGSDFHPGKIMHMSVSLESTKTSRPHTAGHLAQGSSQPRYGLVLVHRAIPSGTRVLKAFSPSPMPGLLASQAASLAGEVCGLVRIQGQASTPPPPWQSPSSRN